MLDRILKIMDYNKFTPSEFADVLEIDRSRLSHILNGRNKPSLEIVMKILEKFPEISSDWLLFGSGNMLKNLETSNKNLNLINEKNKPTTAELDLNIPNTYNDVKNLNKQIEEEKDIKETIKEDSEETMETPEKSSKKDDISNQGYRNRFDEKLYKTLREFKEIEPLSVKLKNFNWWYIPYDEMGIKTGVLPYYNQIISAYYPYPMSNRVTTCTSLMKKYGHYIFGIYKENDEIARFIYGVPGEFTKEEQPYKGVTGFKNWSYANKDNKGESGYWLAFVNPKTGEITDPPQVSLT